MWDRNSDPFTGTVSDSTTHTSFTSTLSFGLTNPAFSPNGINLHCIWSQKAVSRGPTAYTHKHNQALRRQAEKSWKLQTTPSWIRYRGESGKEAEKSKQCVNHLDTLSSMVTPGTCKQEIFWYGWRKLFSTFMSGDMTWRETVAEVNTKDLVIERSETNQIKKEHFLFLFSSWTH